ncbi:hypothetical protein JCM14469_09140 [Desulfatiferula olefinivorans]
MNKRLATLAITMLVMAFSGHAQALDLTETGKVTMHGFITQGYLLTDDNNFLADTEDDGTSQFNEIGINFSSDVSERLRMGIQFIARDLGQMGNHEVTIDWAVADYSIIDWFNVRAGKIKMPRGLYNTGRDIDMLRTFVFLPQSIYTEGWRDSINTLSGASVYGYVPVSFLGDMTYDLLGGNIAMAPDGGEARLLEDQVPTLLNLDVQDMNTVMSWDASLTLDSFLTLDGLKLATNYLYHEFDATCDVWDGTVVPTIIPGVGASGDYIFPSEQSLFHVEMDVISVGLEYTFGNTVFAAEYSDTGYKLNMPLFKNTRAIDKDFHSVGYYGSVSHRFTDWFELGVYYSEYYANKDDKDGKDAVAESVAFNSLFTGLVGVTPPVQDHAKWLKDTCVAFRFDLTPNWILKAETHFMDGAALLFSADGNMNAAGTATDYEDKWMLYAMKLSYSF